MIGYIKGSHFTPSDAKVEAMHNRGHDISNYCTCGAEYMEHHNGECPVVNYEGEEDREI